MDYPVINQQGGTVRTIELDDAVFGVPMNPTLLHQALVIYQGNKRQGTADTKTRAQVSGGGRKPWIQKHTGRARQGSIRSPQWRHGGVVFGPHPRDYRRDLPRRMRRQALKCALSERVRQGNLICLDSLDTLDGRTRSMTTLLGNLGISGSAIIITVDSQEMVFRAGHNLPKVWTTPVNLLNANDLLSRQSVVMTVDAARKVEEMWAAPLSHRQRRLARAEATLVPAGPETPTDPPAAPPEAESESDEAAAAPPAPRRRRRTATPEAESPEPEATEAESPEEESAE
jgi:large subunit ribosomal protein L4